jgi:hypothetical protein
MKKNLNSLMKIALIAAMLGSVSQVKAAVVLTSSWNNTTQTAFTGNVSSSDLVNNGSSSLSGVTINQTINNPANVNNGSDAGIFYYDGNPLVLTQESYTVVFDLDVSVNTFGYNISSINTFSGWQDGRVFQDFMVEFSVVGSSLYSSLGSFSYLASDVPGAFPLSANNSLWLNIVDNSGNIATGVDSIRFTLNEVNVPGFSLLGSAYREIDVLGAATVVPEPSVMSLFIGAVILFMALRRRLILG